jgi:hypothetical protein
MTPTSSFVGRCRSAASLVPLLLPLLVLLALAVVPALRTAPTAAHTGVVARAGGPVSLAPARQRDGAGQGHGQGTGTREGRATQNGGSAAVQGALSGAPLTGPAPAPDPADAAPGTAPFPAFTGGVALLGAPSTHVTGVVAGLPARRGPPAGVRSPVGPVHPRPA